MKTHRIDILMAVYNGEKYIKEQIQSILNQTFKDFHLIIRDNCSIDSTREMIQTIREDHPEKITLLTSPSNIGPAGNFSALLSHSEAPYAMFADCDDVWLPEKIELTLSEMLKHEMRYGTSIPILVHTDLSVVNRELQIINPSFWNYSHLNPRKGRALNRLVLQNSVTGCTLMINRFLRDLANPIPKEAVMHDWWLALVAAAFGHIGLVNQPTMLYRQHGNNDTGAKKFTYKIKKMTEEQRDRENKFEKKRHDQANLFLFRYDSILKKDQKEALNAFLKHENEPLWRRIYLIVKYGFFKHGFFRSVEHLFPLLKKIRILKS